MQRIILLTMSALLVLVSAFPGGKVSAEGKRQLTVEEVKQFAEDFFKRNLNDKSVPGAIFTVVQGDKVLLNQGYGYADVESKKRIDPQATLFRVASIAKVVTAAASMQLVEQGKLKLDQNIEDYLGGPKLQNPFSKPVTSANLLTHTAGFTARDAQETDSYKDLDAYLPLEDFLKQMLRPVKHEPGEAVMYDNFGWMLQGYIVQQIAKTPFEDYVNKAIFTPLGMNHSTFRLTSKLAQQLATAYDGAGNPLPLHEVAPTVQPQGSMLSTGEDMAKFLISQLNGGALGNNRILKESSVKEMQTFHHYAAPGVPDTAYGYEPSNVPWKDNGQKVVGKDGDYQGFTSYMWLIPEQSIGVFVSFTASTQLREQLYSEFMDHFFPAKPVQVQFLNTPVQDLQAVEGSYRKLRTFNAVVQIKAVGNGEIALSGLNGKAIKFRQTGPQVFKDENGATLAFVNDSAGTPKYFKYLGVDYFEKIKLPTPFTDVSSKSPYAKFIDPLYSFGFLNGRSDGKFSPEGYTTRAEFVHFLVTLFGLTPRSSEPAFKDTAGHWAEADLQTAAEGGLLTPDSKGNANPDQVITRQEAAYLFYQVVRGMWGITPQDAKLAPGTDSWALESVKTVVALGLYGPEAKKNEDGSVDYRSKQPLKRQEAAVFFYTLVNPPS
ncbi:serine hydrolase [Paenibacillus tuaregi]|uniref:serine hydrolase n=1 Tax=Paenibacillus tuaregi TaxID=1816681 RepID=UPI0008380928|nr:serine hydrolase [Paenibacillus tuaregi]